MRSRSDLCHVVHPTRLIIYMGQHHNRHLMGDRICNVLGCGRAQLVIFTDGIDQALCHVEIAGKVAIVGQDHPAVGPHHQRRRQSLVDLDRQRVASDH